MNHTTCLQGQGTVSGLFAILVLFYPCVIREGACLLILVISTEKKKKKSKGKNKRNIIFQMVQRD